MRTLFKLMHKLGMQIQVGLLIQLSIQPIFCRSSIGFSVTQIGARERKECERGKKEAHTEKARPALHGPWRALRREQQQVARSGGGGVGASVRPAAAAAARRGRPGGGGPISAGSAAAAAPANQRMGAAGKKRLRPPTTPANSTSRCIWPRPDARAFSLHFTSFRSPRSQHRRHRRRSAPDVVVSRAPRKPQNCKKVCEFRVSCVRR